MARPCCSLMSNLLVAVCDMAAASRSNCPFPLSEEANKHGTNEKTILVVLGESD